MSTETAKTSPNPSSNPRGTILIILSSAHSITLRSKSDPSETISPETGFFLKELAQPLSLLLDEGYDVTFASPGGEPPQMDPLSDSPLWFLGNWYEKNRNLDIVKRLEKRIYNPEPLSKYSENPNELDKYLGIFVPGGHAPMSDLGKDKNLGEILNHFHYNGKPTAVICHGPIALLSTSRTRDGFAYKGYKVTCYANKEELTNELMWGGKLEKKVENALREAGAQVEVATVPLLPKVVRDRELISGEGPSSVIGFAQEFIKALKEKPTVAGT